MASYQELIQQREALEKAIALARQQEIAQALSQVKGLVNDFGLTAEDIFGGGSKTRASKPSGKVAPKYRDSATGSTWTGRGKPPKWIQGKDRTAFAIG